MAPEMAESGLPRVGGRMVLDTIGRAIDVFWCSRDYDFNQFYGVACQRQIAHPSIIDRNTATESGLADRCRRRHGQ